MQIFEYTSLSSHKNQIIRSFHDKGVIAVRGVPGFDEAYGKFIQASREFMNLSEENRHQYTPHDSYGRGWSYGIETFNSVTDSFKGSYYIRYPDEPIESPNIWPSQDVPQFKETYLELVKIIFRTGQEILPLINIPLQRVTSVARMLYYGPIHSPDAVEWCGEHRDHGLLTGLCGGTYFLDGQKMQQPTGTGLFIRGEEISVPEDVLLFQIGETAELISNGAVTATEHQVRKAVGGYERYNLALFITPMPDYVMTSKLTKYSNRFLPGMHYEEWEQRSYAAYN